MKCAIQLIFSEEYQTQINSIRRVLAERGVHDEAVPVNHISLADIEVDESELIKVEQILNDFASSHKCLNLVLSSVGTFMSKENVLFIAPTMTEELMKYNDELVSMLASKNIKCGKYYTKNNWQPHCTIAIRLSDNELIKGFQVLKDNINLPINACVESIDLLRYNPKPYEELMKFNLKK